MDVAGGSRARPRRLVPATMQRAFWLTSSGGVRIVVNDEGYLVAPGNKQPQQPLEGGGTQFTAEQHGENTLCKVLSGPWSGFYLAAERITHVRVVAYRWLVAPRWHCWGFDDANRRLLCGRAGTAPADMLAVSLRPLGASTAGAPVVTDEQDSERLVYCDVSAMPQDAAPAPADIVREFCPVATTAPRGFWPALPSNNGAAANANSTGSEVGVSSSGSGGGGNLAAINGSLAHFDTNYGDSSSEFDDGDPDSEDTYDSQFDAPRLAVAGARSGGGGGGANPTSSSRPISSRRSSFWGAVSGGGGGSGGDDSGSLEEDDVDDDDEGDATSSDGGVYDFESEFDDDDAKGEEHVNDDDDGDRDDDNASESFDGESGDDGIAQPSASALSASSSSPSSASFSAAAAAAASTGDKAPYAAVPSPAPAAPQRRRSSVNTSAAAAAAAAATTTTATTRPRRHMVVEEIIRTEMAYVRALDVLLDKYAAPLRDRALAHAQQQQQQQQQAQQTAQDGGSGSSGGGGGGNGGGSGGSGGVVLTVEEVSALFGQLPPIRDLSRALLAELKKVGVDGDVGLVFKKHARFMLVYKGFLDTRDTVQRVLDGVLRDETRGPRLKAYVRACMRALLLLLLLLLAVSLTRACTRSFYQLLIRSLVRSFTHHVELQPPADQRIDVRVWCVRYGIRLTVTHPSLLCAHVRAAGTASSSGRRARWTVCSPGPRSACPGTACCSAS